MKNLSMYPRFAHNKYIVSEGNRKNEIVISTEDRKIFHIWPKNLFEIMKQIDGVTTISKLYSTFEKDSRTYSIDDLCVCIENTGFFIDSNKPTKHIPQFTGQESFTYSKKIGPFSPCISPVNISSKYDQDKRLKYIVTGLKRGL